ncbi:elongation of very long chain fatty acids protein 7-like [Macrosteles quadrilineatus]|uniref:elongation of very long chain fatty acids protein 7-like n=1 Tax=Macrosteles quadrilineatus TaxID=74068 RepID=UPI0023E2952E|nr:elongation of very long chain fatty acids protein 7-like [Macrosteles quadrilineatus]
MTVEVEYMIQNVNLTDEFYSNLIDPDRLMETWILFSTPVLIITLISYFLFVFKLGPMYMEKRSPYKLKTVMRLYNVVQIIYNSTIVYNFLVPQVGVMPLPFLTRISCSVPKPFEGLDYLKSLYIYGAWHFQMLKNLDLLDTVFMVLRKKNSHITFLHVYHHAAMVFFPWFSLRFIKASQGSIPVFINLIVHAIMYSYYFLTTFKAFKKYLWWKHHLTKLQLFQFVVILAYISILYYKQCPISRSFTYIWLANVFFILCLFLNFYIKSYIVKGSDVKNKDKVT